MNEEQKNKIREDFGNHFGKFITNNDYSSRVILEWFLFTFDSLQAEAKEELRKEIEKLKVESDSEDERDYYNFALDKVLQILKDKSSK